MTGTISAWHRFAINLDHSSMKRRLLRPSLYAASVFFALTPNIMKAQCMAVTAPWTEDFEGPTFSGTNTFDPCWRAVPASTLGVYSWWLETYNTGYFGTGPSADHTTGIPGTGKYIYTLAVWGSTGDQVEVRTPFIDISGITNPTLRFWKHFHGAGIGSFFVEVDTGSGFQTIYATHGPGPQTASADPWVEEVLSLNAFSGSTALQIRFRAISGGYLGDLALDDISVDVGPSCFKPSAISVVSVDTNDVTLDWVPSSGISWEVAYGAPRFNPDAAVGSPNGPIGIVPASTHPFTVTGLTASTAYHFYVREACVAVPGVSSEWRGFASALTNCASAVTAAPWTEDFESPNFALSNIFDPCWTTIPASGPVYSWWVETRYIKPYTGPSADHTTGVPGAGQYIYAHSSHGSVGDQAEILTPLIDISGITNPELRFWKHFHGAHIDSFFVEVDAGSGFQKIYATYGPGPQTTSTDPWVGEVLNLNAFAGSIALQIRFRAICGGFASSLALDDISVGSCLLMATADNAAPDALMANITGGTPTLQLPVEYGRYDSDNHGIGIWHLHGYRYRCKRVFGIWHRDTLSAWKSYTLPGTSACIRIRQRKRSSLTTTLPVKWIWR